MKTALIALIASVLLVIPPNTPFAATPVGNSEVVVEVTQEQAKLVVEGPTNAEVGELVVISVEKSSATTFKWITLPSTPDFLVIDDGKRAVFSSRKGGEYKFIIACSLGDTCDVVVHTVFIEGEPDTPSAPGTSLSSKIATWCNQVNSENKKGEALKLAQSFNSVGLIIDGGSLSTPSEIVAATSISNREALGDSLEAWKPFRTGLAEELRALAEAGLLPDAEAHAKVWKGVASALREYAETL